MRLNHLTDREVQTYLDSGRTELADQVETHIKECSACRAALEQYAEMYTAITRHGGETADSRFSDRVMERVAELPLPERPAERNLYWLLSIAGVPVGLGLIVYTLYLTDTLAATQAYLLSGLGWATALIGAYSDILSHVEISPMLLVGSAGVALLGSQIDRLRKLVNRTHTLA